MSSRRWIGGALALAVLLANAESQSSAEPVECSAQDTTFELRTGYVFTSPQEILDTRPDTLQLSECIDACRANTSCAALNFETGLCVLFRTNALDAPGKIQTSFSSSSSKNLPQTLLKMSGVRSLFPTTVGPAERIVFQLINIDVPNGSGFSFLFL